MKNFSIGKDEMWTETIDGHALTFTEVIRQEYTNMLISGGLVEGHPIDTLYISMEKEGKHAFFLLMRPDEFAALAWCLTGTLWTDAMTKLEEKPVTPEPSAVSATWDAVEKRYTDVVMSDGTLFS